MIHWLNTILVIVIAGNQISNEEIVKVSVPTVTVRAGDHSVITIAIEVTDGYHIQASNVGTESIIPTTLEIESDKEISLKSPNFPSTKKFILKGTDQTLDVYDGRFDITILFRTTKQIRKGLHRLDGKLNYQACDSVRCLFPRAAKFTAEVDVR